MDTRVNSGANYCALEQSVKRFGLTEIYTPQAKPTADVVFIHGLYEHPYYTWTSEKSGVFWPAQLLPSLVQREESRTRILVYGYDADIASFATNASSDKIHNHGEQLVAELVANRRVQQAIERPLVFIAYSLGGLVLKSALLYSSNIRGNHTKHLRSIFISTYGLLFLGTPHKGVDTRRWLTRLEAICQAASPSKVADYIPHLIEAVEPNSEILQINERQFVQLSSRFHIYLFHEGKPTAIGGSTEYLVDEYSAAPTIQDVERGVIQQDHLHMCKFESNDAPGFSLVAEGIQRYSNDAPGTISLRWSSERAEQLARKEAEASEIVNSGQYDANPISTISAGLCPFIDWDRLRRCLSPKEVLQEHAKHKRAHLPETASWLFEIQEYSVWKSKDANSPLLWVDGPPGSGKSVLAFNFVQQLRTECKLRNDSNVCYYYCKHDAKDAIQPFTVLKTLAFQMALQSYDFAAALCEALKHHGIFQNKEIEQCIPYDSFWDLLLGALEACLGLFRITYWILDGVDELDVRQRLLLLDSVCEFATRFPFSRVLILSRNEHDIRRHLLRSNATEIFMSQESNRSDIQKYVSDRMKIWGALGSAHIFKEVGFNLNTGANGSFLWVKLVMDELEKIHDLDKVIATLAQLPNDMKELYNRIFQKLRDRLDTEELQLFESIMTWTALSQTTLTLSELASDLSLRLHGTFSSDGLRLSMPRLCGSLIVIDAEKCRNGSVSIHFVHASLADYLTAQNDPNCKFSLNIVEGHGLITSVCFAQFRAVSQCSLFYPIGLASIYQLSTFDLGRLTAAWNEETGPDVIDPEYPHLLESTSYISRHFIMQQYPLFYFARNHWFYHMEQCASDSIIGKSIAEEFLDLIFRGPSMMIWQSAANMAIGVDIQKAASSLLNFCSRSVLPDYLGIEIIFDIATQMTRSQLSGWMYGLDKMRGWVLRQKFEGPPVMDFGDEQIVRSERRKRFRWGVNAHQAGRYQSALQAYTDSCGLESLSLENMALLTAEERLSIFTTIISHLCEKGNLWLLVVFSSAVRESQNDDWQKDFVFSFDRCIGSDPKLLEIRAQLSFSWTDYKAAAELYLRLSETQADRWEIREMLISALSLSGQTTKAMEVLNLFQPDPSTHNSWFLAAWNEHRRIKVYRNEGAHKLAATTCAQAVLRYPDWWDLWNEMKTICLEAGLSSTALEYLRQARNKPSFAIIASGESTRIMLRNHEYKDAIDQCLSIINEYPRISEAYDVLWYCWRSVPDAHKQALLYRLRALAEEPEAYWVAIVYYIRACMELKMLDDALKACQRPSAAKDKESMVWTTAKVYEAHDQPEEALRILCAAPLNKFHAAESFWCYLASLARKLERWVELQQALVRLKERVDDWTAADCECLAWAHYRLRNFIECEKECRTGLNKIPEPIKEDQDENAMEARLSKRNLHFILSLSHASQGHTDIAINACLDVAAFDVRSWYELARFFGEFDFPALASFCLDAGLQELQPKLVANDIETSRLLHKYWTCDSCGALDFAKVGYSDLGSMKQGTMFDLCEDCFAARSEAMLDESRSRWLACPSTAYPRLRIWEEDGERKREVSNWNLNIRN